MPKPQGSQHLSEDGRVRCERAQGVVITQEMRWNVETPAETARVPHGAWARTRRRSCIECR